jgi:valine dehydrogenase (NAD+)
VIVSPPGGFAGDFEDVVEHRDPATGLHAFVAVFSTALGPALGGTRFHAYPDLGAARADVMDLARAMAYKNAVAGLPHGGGKAVVVGDPARDKSEPLLRAYGRFVESLGGRYITAADVGTYVTDLDVVAQECRYVTGRSTASGGAGDTGEQTAVGVFQGMRAVAEHLWGAPSLAGRRVGIVGVGKVGRRLARLLLDDGARLLVSDVSPAAVEALRAEVGDGPIEVAPDEAAVASAELDVYAPCALGHALTADRVAQLGAAAVCGAANNQLAAPEVGELLARRGVLYAPDYVVNAGGVIAVADEWLGRTQGGGYQDARARHRILDVARTTRDVLAAAAAQGIRPEQAADRMAEDRMRAAQRRLEPGSAPSSSRSA